jgi:hypothetical protein
VISRSFKCYCSDSDTEGRCGVNYGEFDKKFFNTEYMGEGALREVAETWYSKLSFFVPGLRHMKSFLHSDVSGLSILPMNHVRAVHLLLREAHLHKSSTDRVPLNCMRFPYETDDTSSLQHLSGLKKGARIYIGVEINNSVVYDPDRGSSQPYII